MGESKEIYAWGMGENCVLGNRKDENEYFPMVLDSRMFEENVVV
jgi:alpha-tubulin suppressor-like RCC1 family protein